ncbi:nuclear transport factor 2 family protein [Pseudonocardia sp. KRD291]|uniref:aromatic-ring-hydroxylating dioxygenase subunit beta n=1 Tax=Pseudonocardia sp. KRD291 TaxID=2792007 RepID=UPI001C49F826|nr:nuclear transport factor 2 family protein [Pseudonocardia sp. KRD291]MBW0101054.1 nuclear transport factor 2 family protein [Pseudonocardia sp. KRD291]
MAIGRAQAHYVRCIDDDRLEEWPDFFTETCHYRITTADNHRRGLPAGLMWADTRGMLTDRVSALREANIYERQSYRHIIGQPAILRESDTESPTGGGIEVESETPFLVVRITGDGPMDLFASGRYLDRYLIDGPTALLRSRVVVCDSSETDTLLALPL